MTLFVKNSFKIFHKKIGYLQELRFYARWSHRRPRRVLTDENEIETPLQEVTKTVNVTNSLRESQSKWFPKSVQRSEQLTNTDAPNTAIDKKIEKRVKRKKPKYIIQKNDSTISSDMLETVIDANGDLVYTKLKDNDSTVSQLLLTVKSRRQQVKQDLALLEGKRLIRDALKANCTLKNLIFSRKSDIEYLKPYLPKSGAKLFKMPYRNIQLWSDLTTTPGLMGIFKTPNVMNFVPKDNFPITIICDNIREPGNLGAILRTVAGVGVKKVLLTNGCVDLWDTKVLRSACGAHFHLQIHKQVDWSNIREIVNGSQSAIFLADNNIVMESGTDVNNVEEQSLPDIIMKMPLLPYYSVQFTNFKDIALVVGGETHGISEESFRLAAKFNGVRLNIPLSNSIDSLNAATALGVILFEIKKQMLQHVDVKN